MRILFLIFAFGYMIYVFLSKDKTQSCDLDCEFCPFPPCEHRKEKDGGINRMKKL